MSRVDKKKNAQNSAAFHSLCFAIRAAPMAKLERFAAACFYKNVPSLQR